MKEIYVTVEIELNFALYNRYSKWLDNYSCQNIYFELMSSPVLLVATYVNIYDPEKSSSVRQHILLCQGLFLFDAVSPLICHLSVKARNPPGITVTFQLCLHFYKNHGSAISCLLSVVLVTPKLQIRNLVLIHLFGNLLLLLMSQIIVVIHFSISPLDFRNWPRVLSTSHDGCTVISSD